MPNPTAGDPAECEYANREILELWNRHRALTQQRRQSRAEILQLRPRLGELLFAKQCHLGQTGEFQAWLRRHHIAKATAYRLIAAHTNVSNSRPVKRLTRLSETRKPLPRGWELQGDRLIVQLDARQLQAFQAAVSNVELLLIPYNIPDAICQNLKSLVDPLRTKPSPAAKPPMTAALPPAQKPAWPARLQAVFKRPSAPPWQRPDQTGAPSPTIEAPPAAPL